MRIRVCLVQAAPKHSYQTDLHTMPFDSAANAQILRGLFEEMAKEQLADGGGKESDFSDITKEDAEAYIHMMKQQMRDDTSGIFKALYEKSLTAQYHKALLLHHRGIDLTGFTFVYVATKDE